MTQCLDAVEVAKAKSWTGSRIKELVSRANDGDREASETLDLHGRACISEAHTCIDNVQRAHANRSGVVAGWSMCRQTP